MNENRADQNVRKTSKTSKNLLRNTQLIVMANRLPFKLVRNKETGNLSREESAGGLVTAVAPVVVAAKGAWVGWTGLYDFGENDVIPESDANDRSAAAGFRSKQAVPVIMGKKMFDQFYNGMCNATLWPLFHSMPDRAIFQKVYWEAYVKVNTTFAETAMEVIRKAHGRTDFPLDPPLVWVHDYQLMLAASIVRAKCQEEHIPVRLGFFLHIPFPSYDILQICPWAKDIITGLLANDLVGFHTEMYRLNFVECVKRIGAWTTGNKELSQKSRSVPLDLDNSSLVNFMNRYILVKELPIGIPYNKFENLAKLAPVALPPMENLKYVLGVDRLDYTKGLKARMLAIERLFEIHPEWREKVLFIQVAVPSRTDVKEYQELKQELDELVGRINGRFGTPLWSPIRYINHNLPQEKLPGYYKDSHVALITPLRDGMNLVAKEYVACQKDDNPGVLILSPFAGASQTMHGALVVNPYEMDNVAEAIHTALNMSLQERKMRMSLMKIKERVQNCDYWVKNFTEAVGHIQHFNMETKLLGSAKSLFKKISFSGIDFERMLGESLDVYQRVGLILDFDGTLSFLAKTPDMAIINPEIKKSLERLSNLSDVSIVVISGRSMEDLRSKVGIEGITYAANHGLRIMKESGKILNQELPPEYAERLKFLQADLKHNVEKYGAWVEHKELLVAWHYREIESDQKHSMIKKAKEIFKRHNFESLHTSKRIENTPPRGINRGESCLTILETLFGMDWEDRVKVIYAGDSESDEQAISRLRGIATTFRVTNEDSTPVTKTTADYWLTAGPEGVLKLTRFLEKVMMGRSPRSISGASSSTSLDRLVDATTEEHMSKKNHELSPPFRQRTLSSGSAATGQRRKKNVMATSNNDRVRTKSWGSHGNLCKTSLYNQIHNRLSREETGVMIFKT